MKKIIALLSLALFINLTIARAQSSSTSTATTEPKKETVKCDASKQCTGVTAACPHPCTGDKASGTSSTATLSDNHSNAGSAAATSEKKSTSSACTDKSVCTGKDTKSCCKSSSKASAMMMRTKPVKATTEVAPKEATVPQQ